MSERVLTQPTQTVDGSPAYLTNLPEACLAYNTNLDVEAFRVVTKGVKENQPAVQTALENLITLTKNNVYTSIAERYNAEIHTAQYFLKDGLLTNAAYPEPFIEVMRRGQKFRAEKGSRDLAREHAEVVGFEKVQELFKSGSLGDEANVIIISPRGGKNSTYQHNFFDHYKKQKDGQITMTRLASKSTYADFRQAAAVLDQLNNLPQEPTDTDFLAHPLVTYKTEEEIKQTLNINSETLPNGELEKHKDHLKLQTNHYINTLLLGASPEVVNREYNRILKLAEVLLGKDPYLKEEQKIRIIKDPTQINHLSDLTLRAVAAACGLSGNNFSRPFSVADFANASFDIKDQYGTLEIRCENPNCRAVYLRNFGRLEDNCRYCGGTKGIAC